MPRDNERQVIPAIKLKKIREDDEILDLDMSEIECVKRYHSAFRAFVTSGIQYPLTKPLKEEDIGKNIQSTIVDWSVAHAMQGSAVIDELQANMSYTVLQAALILTITIPLFINVPDFDDENYVRAFSAVVGFSAFSHILVLIGCTIQNMILNRPYSSADTLLARVETFSLFAFIVAINYVGLVCGLVATLIAGFGRSSLDGYIQLYSIGIVIYLLYLFVVTYQKGTVYQDRRIYRFYKKYCDDDGQLKDEYIERIRKDVRREDIKDDEQEDDQIKNKNVMIHSVGAKPMVRKSNDNEDQEIHDD